LQPFNYVFDIMLYKLKDERGKIKNNATRSTSKLQAIQVPMHIVLIQY